MDPEPEGVEEAADAVERFVGLGARLNHAKDDLLDLRPAEERRLGPIRMQRGCWDNDPDIEWLNPGGGRERWREVRFRHLLDETWYGPWEGVQDAALRVARARLRRELRVAAWSAGDAEVSES